MTGRPQETYNQGGRQKGTKHLLHMVAGDSESSERERERDREVERERRSLDSREAESSNQPKVKLALLTLWMTCHPTLPLWSI